MHAECTILGHGSNQEIKTWILFSYLIAIRMLMQKLIKIVIIHITADYSIYFS